MRLLLDQTLSLALKNNLEPAFPDNAHVRDFNPQSADLRGLWRQRPVDRQDAVIDDLRVNHCQGAAMSHMVNFRADDELNARLERLARLTGRTKTFYVREAVAAYMDDLEDIYLADQVMDRIDSGRESVHSLEELERELGLAD